jgi:tetratricopeptide (TPR) repeat protein
MSGLLVGALSVMLSTNAPMAISNYVTLKTGMVPALPPSKAELDPRYPDLRRVMELDDAADDRIGQWINERKAGDPTDPRMESELALRARVEALNGEIRREYEALLEKHPDYAAARNAFASFLAESGDEEGAIRELEKASELDPKDPAVWNNLANHYGHIGPIEKAFPAYERAIELNPFEPVYRYNLATVVFLFRKDAREYYQCDETAVFEKALAMYREVRRLRPFNFRYAFDFAQTFYGVRVATTLTAEEQAEGERRLGEAALEAWREALELADNEVDREGIQLHMARWRIRQRRFDEARVHLLSVTNEVHLEMRQRLERNVREKEALPVP